MDDKLLDFQEKLIMVQDTLSQEEVQQLVFFCSDLLEKDLSRIQSARDLFSLLQNQDCLSAEDMSLLVELLSITQHYSLIKKLNLDKEIAVRRISHYRKLLFELSEHFSEEDVKTIKFLLSDSLPRRKLQSDTTLLQLFMEMEKKDLMNANNLDYLERIVDNTHPLLKRNIEQYKASLSQISDVAVQMNSNLNVMDPTVATKAVQTLEKYVMNGDWRGHCLIINNFDFSAYPKLNNREGTDTDERSLTAVFKWLGFQIHTTRDCSGENILKAMEDLRNQDHTDADCVVCCVLSHGYNGGVYGVDGTKVTTSELTEPLFGNRCQSLSQKPKLFFIQACQGDNEHPPAFLQSDNSESGIVCDAVSFIESIPSGADFLISIATLPQYVSFRHTKMGSWFIQSLCENLLKLVPSGCDVLSILTEVNRDVSLKNADKMGNRKQMPKPEYTLRKRVVFPVPKTPAPMI